MLFFISYGRLKRCGVQVKPHEMQCLEPVGAAVTQEVTFFSPKAGLGVIFMLI